MVALRRPVASASAEVAAAGDAGPMAAGLPIEATLRDRIVASAEAAAAGDAGLMVAAMPMEATFRCRIIVVRLCESEAIACCGSAFGMAVGQRGFRLS